MTTATNTAAVKLLPRHHDEFRSKEYWDTFFKQRTDAFEWYGEYGDLRKLVHRTLRRTDEILVIGCGNSNFSAELYDDGFEEIENVDFSEAVISEMRRAHFAARPRMTWRVMDVTDMSRYEDGRFDAVLDKGTLDALMSEDTAEVRKSGESMLREVKRVLKPSGRYMCVTLWQDFIGSAFLSSFSPAADVDADAARVGGGTGRRCCWALNLHSAAAASKPSPYLPVCVIAAASPPADAEGWGESGSVSAWCDSAGRPLAPGADPVVLDGEKEVLRHVREAQQMHRRRVDLREMRPGRFEKEDLWGEGSRESPRFTLLIVDVSADGRAGTIPCAVVLIPRGRDRDFTFSAREGLEEVARSANARRLIAVRLNRGHDFSDGVEGVKAEISPSISEFAPEASAADAGGPGIPIMAVGDGLGAEGRVVAEGHLESSGSFVVEEEEEEEDEQAAGRPAGVYRRLIFLRNEGVVQTEVRMLGEDEEDRTGPSSRSSSSKGAGRKKGKGKGKAKAKAKGGKKLPAAAVGSVPGVDEDEVDEGLGRVDSSHLCFEYHRCMVAGAALADLRMPGGGGKQKDAQDDGRAPTALVIGLGGGALPMALRRMYPRMKVATVELDPGMPAVAKEHFGLRESSNGLKVIVADGLTFVGEKAAAAAAAAAPVAEATGILECPKPGESTAVSGNDADVHSPTAEAVPPPPPPPEVEADQTGWGEAFGPPYSAIFLDVDSKDTSVGMSCPPAAFLEISFLRSLKTLLLGGGGVSGGGGPGVLAINVAARSKELFRGAVDSVCAAFAGGEVHQIRASEDDVNSVVLALPRPRARAKSGSLFAVAEQALSSSTVPRKALASILEVCERAEAVSVTNRPSTNTKMLASGKSGKSKRTGR